MYQSHVALSRCANGCASNGSPDMTVMSPCGDPGGVQAVHRALRGVGIRIQRVDGAHGCASPSTRSDRSCAVSWTACSPTFSSQIEMIGTNFANSV